MCEVSLADSQDLFQLILELRLAFVLQFEEHVWWHLSLVSIDLIIQVNHRLGERRIEVFRGTVCSLRVHWALGHMLLIELLGYCDLALILFQSNFALIRFDCLEIVCVFSKCFELTGVRIRRPRCVLQCLIVDPVITLLRYHLHILVVSPSTWVRWGSRRYSDILQLLTVWQNSGAHMWILQ